MAILKAIGLHEFQTWEILRRLLAELLGTFLLVALILSGLYEIKSAVGFAIANGLLLASVIAFTGHISGGHVNPAVTVGMLICKYIRLLPALCYVIVQVFGALLGQFLAKMIVNKEYQNNVKNNQKKMAVQSKFGLEVLESFLLVSVALSVTDPKRSSRGIGSAALAIGLSVSGSLCAVTEYRASFNPVAYLATSLFQNTSVDWVCWVGPLVGGVFAGLVYRFLLGYSKPARIQVTYRP